MGLSSEGDQEVRACFQEVCSSLNMDRLTSDQALNTYENISMNYTLEGNMRHWIACALYVECRNGNVPTVAHTSRIEGNCVSLTRLLSICRISLLDFFTKMKKWADMANLNERMRQRIETIEKSFCVTAKIYEKYVQIFATIFKEHQGAAQRRSIKAVKRRVHRPTQCNSNDMFNFIWTLYVYIKGRFSAICCDLVNCYHLLLCCIDYGYCTALAAKRVDLLDPKFYEAQQDKLKKDSDNQDVGIIRELVKSHDGNFEDASVLKAHHFRYPIQQLMEEKILHGDFKTLALSLEPAAFDTSIKKLNKTYEEGVLKEGDLDERIFLDDNAQERIGTPRHTLDSVQRELRMCQADTVVKLVEVPQLLTPLTGRSNLHNREAINRSPVSTATQCASKLQALLAGCKNAPSKELQALFSTLDPSLEAIVLETVKSMGDAFCTAYAQPTSDQRGTSAHMDFARKRLQLGETLFYKAFENIVNIEMKQKRPNNTDLAAHLSHSVFQQSLFACCLEIVMFCYNSQRDFPWILEVFNLVPYNFYKIIEPLIRAEEGLWREVVKHLNHIEEQILECLSWKDDSPLWDAIEHSEQPVPMCKEVLLQRQIETFQETDGNDIGEPHTPVAHSPLKGPRGDQDGSLSNRKDVPLSPVSVAERFQSPGSAVRRRLFAPNSTGGGASAPLQQSPRVESGAMGQTRTVSITVQPVQAGCTTRYVTVDSKSAAAPTADGTRPNIVTVTSAPEVPKENKPLRSGSLALFFRKVYHLAGVRFQDLCARLGILQKDIQLKIWTCFEHSIVCHIDLMKDRHLDQLILCAVYVITKVTRVEKSFQEILHCYRQQPQNKSHVYRSVLLRKNPTHSDNSSRTGSNSSSPVPVDKDDGDNKRTEQLSSTRSSSTLPMMLPNSQPPTPTRLAGTATQFEFDERGDIIKFYNEIYRKRMTTFAIKFSPDSSKNESVGLTPLPRAKCVVNSPRRQVSHNRKVFVSPLKAGCYPVSPKHHTYHFSQSPAKDLRVINRMVQSSENVSKRILHEDDISEDDSPATKRCFFKKIQTVMKERQDVCGGGSSADN
ncbi:retinoblastoma-like protein 2 isoform X1 [Dermacentor andersoni]|uniref:retinoblastoma-like protein 2 isoform X1 n=1 Tax=Dermacentor andersoni TaxID=34620 RepID=UPI0021552174|nr:retinoblastoma-like protein 1 isoform X1 [Dermacentor andersoni]